MNIAGEEWELIYTSPDKFKRPENSVNQLKVSNLGGMHAEYLIWADIFLIVMPGAREESSLIVSINDDQAYKDYKTIEHQYGLLNNSLFHAADVDVYQYGLLLTQTHNFKTCEIILESKLYTSLFAPNIRSKSNSSIFNDTVNWIEQSNVSMYLGKDKEIKNLIFYSDPSNSSNFYGIIKIYKKIKT